MSYRLYIGDAIEFLQDYGTLGLRPINLTVTSPPYDLDIPYDGTDDARGYFHYKVWARQWIAALYKATADGGRFCLNVPLDTNKGGPRPFYADMVQMALNEGWKYKGTIVWNEGNISSRTAWGSWRSATAPNFTAPVEMIVVFYKGTAWKRKLPEGVPQQHVDGSLFLDSTLAMWTFPGEKKKRFDHPAPFPEELPRRCIEMFSFPGDLVCDPFVGSGTTGAVCRDRDFIGIDISEEYAKTAMSRLAALDFTDIMIQRYPSV